MQKHLTGLECRPAAPFHASPSCMLNESGQFTGRSTLTHCTQVARPEAIPPEGHNWQCQQTPQTVRLKSCQKRLREKLQQVLPTAGCKCLLKLTACDQPPRGSEQNWLCEVAPHVQLNPSTKWGSVSVRLAIHKDVTSPDRAPVYSRGKRFRVGFKGCLQQPMLTRLLALGMNRRG